MIAVLLQGNAATERKRGEKKRGSGGKAHCCFVCLLIGVARQLVKAVLIKHTHSSIVLNSQTIDSVV